METKHELYSLRGTGNYRGCLVTRIIGGWEIFSLKCTLPEHTDQMIDNACKLVENAIIRANTVTVDCSSGSNCAIISNGCEI